MQPKWSGHTFIEEAGVVAAAVAALWWSGGTLKIPVISSNNTLIMTLWCRFAAIMDCRALKLL